MLKIFYLKKRIFLKQGIPQPIYNHLPVFYSSFSRVFYFYFCSVVWLVIKTCWQTVRQRVNKSAASQMGEAWGSPSCELAKILFNCQAGR